MWAHLPHWLQIALEITGAVVGALLVVCAFCACVAATLAKAFMSGGRGL